MLRELSSPLDNSGWLDGPTIILYGGYMLAFIHAFFAVDVFL